MCSCGLWAPGSALGGLRPPSTSYSLAGWTECSQRSHPLPNSPDRPLPTAALRHAGGSSGHQARKPLSSPKPSSQMRWVITKLIGPSLSRGAPRSGRYSYATVAPWPRSPDLLSPLPLEHFLFQDVARLTVSSFPSPCRYWARTADRARLGRAWPRWCGGTPCAAIPLPSCFYGSVGSAHSCARVCAACSRCRGRAFDTLPPMVEQLGGAMATLRH
jgi:hypothetical protein